MLLQTGNLGELYAESIATVCRCVVQSWLRSKHHCLQTLRDFRWDSEKRSHESQLILTGGFSSTD